MGVYILSVMTKEVVDIATIDFIKRKIEVAFPNNIIKYSQYDYSDRKFKELDFDITEILFNKDTIKDEIMLLIDAIMTIFSYLNMECEVIGGYNDTENAIIQYESDKENNYNNWGLFATRNPVSNHSYYYERNGIYIYQSFKFDSMGAVFE